jgi:hypothetical protein
MRSNRSNPGPVVSLMALISYPTSSSVETNASRLCQKKARDCQRVALTAKDPKVRLVFSQLAKMWREMADEAEQEAGGLLKEDGLA